MKPRTRKPGPTAVHSSSPRFGSARHALIAIAWAAFVLYGSLVPLDYRPRPDAWQAFLNIRYLDLGVGSRADWVANILLYVVLAYFATGAVWLARIGRVARLALLVLVLIACIAFAFGIEFAQLFFPPRTVSINDLIAETLGTMLGCLIWFTLGPRLTAMWDRFTDGGAHSFAALLALYAICYLALSLFPYDFLVSRAELADKLDAMGGLHFGPSPACGAGLACSIKLLAEAALAIPFGLLMVLAIRPRRGTRGLNPVWGFALGAGIGLAVETAQIVLASGTTQGVSVLTRAIGVAWGVALANRIPENGVPYTTRSIRLLAVIAAPLHLALILVLNDLVPLTIQPVWAALEQFDRVRFIPFYYHYYTSETEAVRSLLQVAGSFAPIGLVAALAFPGTKRRVVALAVLYALVLCFGVELLKLFSINKRPDPTNLLIAPASVYLLHWVISRVLRTVLRPDPDRSGVAPTRETRTILAAFGRFALVAVLPAGVLVATALTNLPGAPARLGGSARAVPTYPPPQALPAVALPQFRELRPRLPHPSPGDLAQLLELNPSYIESRKRQARGRRPDLDAWIFDAFVSADRDDLGRLHQHLMEQEVMGRAHRPVMSLALAYDWLHRHWSDTERELLRDRLGEGCTRVAELIRSQRLSPYEAALYAGGPLQALMACSIALYRDHPSGEALMAFSHELWINRVLPVWRQVFGSNGGWHEGSEQLAAGIGQAVHSVPGMWRAATGEDLFVAEPGIRGFADFIVYRNRPDGSQFRWGASARFDRLPRDLMPLALELGHAPAYTLIAPKSDPIPTGWPWGPLSSSTLADPAAVSALPLVRHFDGIGMIVARSDWSADATWVSFKAGDSFWSHSHLDQGAFTVYKGGPLAIDSGFASPRYGAEHYLNYAYQTIAHNTITVTDPDDAVLLPSWRGSRTIANDGGQRRIGDIAHVAQAPLDRDEWEAARIVNHTGRIESLVDDDGLMLALADVTPAYTNELSGRGQVSHRTRRVERFWRIFGYDREDDVIVIYDDVRSSDARFRKRWLLHTLEQPFTIGNRFAVDVTPQQRPGRAGGRLEGVVLLPERGEILTVGGPGMEFFIDGRNYDEDGEIWNERRTRHSGAEPGAWRVEIHPPRPAEEDRFLVVLLPTRRGEIPLHQVRLLRSDTEIGCEIAGPKRTTRWWFTPGRKGARVEVERDGVTRLHQLDASGPGVR
ncbi:MAG TPA: VanZ family protein [Rhodocyclaceae bacterium]|nr:VanZ family protein [Rhodocyclaceae bacterium]